MTSSIYYSCRPYCSIAIFILFFIITMVHSDIHRVPENYSSIQSALNASAACDTVLINDGIYIENLIWPSTRGIKLFSVNGAEKTIIKANTSDSLCTILIEPDSSTIIDTSTVIKGFSIFDGIAVGT